jgi:hypothetical protein
MLSVPAIFNPADVESATGVEELAENPMTISRFFVNKVNFVVYHVVALCCAGLYLVFYRYINRYLI